MAQECVDSLAAAAGVVSFNESFPQTQKFHIVL